MARKRRQYTRESKVKAAKLVTEGGITIAQAAQDLDISQSVLQLFPGQGHLKPEAEELRRLCLENRPLQERDTLKKPSPSARITRNEVLDHESQAGGSGSGGWPKRWMCRGADITLGLNVPKAPAEKRTSGLG